MADETPQDTERERSETDTAAAPELSGREERALRDQLAASQRPSRTPAERDAERRDRRAKKAVARRRRREQEKVKRVAVRGDEPARTGTPPAPPKDTSPQMRTGTVVSAKPDKTITVRIDIARRHRRYEKIVRSTTKLHAHDESNDAHEGDVVRVSESRPLSRTKRWKLEEVLERAK
jgi:small subunit ribosomal protein S17